MMNVLVAVSVGCQLVASKEQRTRLISGSVIAECSYCDIVWRLDATAAAAGLVKIHVL